MMRDPEAAIRVRSELADVALYLIRLADVLGNWTCSRPHTPNSTRTNGATTPTPTAAPLARLLRRPDGSTSGRRNGSASR